MLDWVPSAPYTAEQLLEVLRILRHTGVVFPL